MNTMRGILVTGLFLLMPVAAQAALPVGSVVVYSDGRVEKLLAIEGDRQRWEDDRKRQFVRSRNPIIPVLEKRVFLSGRGYTQRLADGNPETISRLPADTPVEFSLVRTRDDGSTTQRHWECTFRGTIKKKVLGKTRTLERYSCTRFKVNRKLHNRMFREKRDIRYSRELGLVVDLRRETSKKRSRSKITAILSPKKASYKRISRAVRNARSSK